MFWLLFVDVGHENLRVFSMLVHFIITFGLVWTKQDIIQVGMGWPRSDHVYETYHTDFLGMIIFAMMCIIFKLSVFLFSTYRVTLSSVFHLMLDVLAIFFIAWIILDGLEWTAYVWVFCFCAFLPALYDLIDVSIFFARDSFISWKNKRTIYCGQKMCGEDRTGKE